MSGLTWKCKCGEVAVEVPPSGHRVVCYCESCRDFALALNSADRLDPQGGSDLLQVAPKGLRIVRGQDRLAYMRMTPKGPLRWYTRCCGTPMANTLATRALPFASLQVHDLAPSDDLPPVRARVNLSGATGRVEGARGSVLSLILGVLGKAAWTHLTLRARHNPFFNSDGSPAGPEIDPREELT